MTKVGYFLLFFFSFFLSCNKLIRIPESQTGKVEKLISIVPSKESGRPFDLTPYLDTVKYVKLESTDESIFGSIDKMIVYEDSIYILDKITNSLLVFDMEGNYLYKIAKRGPGPDEYTQLDFFDIDRENKQIVLTDLMAYWIMRYDMNGNFLYKQKIPIWCEGVSVLPNGGIVLYANFRNNSSKLKQEYNLICLNSNMDFEKGYFPYKSENFNIKIATSAAGHFYRSNDHLNFSFPRGNTVYQFYNDSLIKKYKFDFGNEILPVENPGSAEKFMEYYNNNKYCGFWSYIMENDDLLFFTIQANVEVPFIYVISYSKESGNILLSSVYMIENVFSVGHPKAGYGPWIVSEIEAYSLIEWRDAFSKEQIAFVDSYTKERLTLAETLTKNDNSVLMFYKLKPF